MFDQINYGFSLGWLLKNTYAFLLPAHTREFLGNFSIFSSIRNLFSGHSPFTTFWADF